MYLSKIKLNIAKNKTQQTLQNPNLIHGAIEISLGENSKKLAKLWRLDMIQGELYLLILSEIEPDFSIIKQQFGYETETPLCKDYNCYLDRIVTDQKWKFRLVTNPIKHEKAKDGQNGKRGKIIALEKERDELEWLKKQAPKYGFCVKKKKPMLFQKCYMI